MIERIITFLHLPFGRSKPEDVSSIPSDPNHEGIGEDAPLLGDEPLGRPEDDRFGRWPFAQRIAETIADLGQRDSLVIGLFGKWGEGKTTVLNYVDQALRGKEHTVVVRFNPWRFKNETQLLSSFFQSLADSLKLELSTKGEKVAKQLESYGSIVSAFSVGGMSIDAEKLAQPFSSVELEETKQRLERLLGQTGKTVVILIDDIDRLQKREVQNIFRLVRLSGDIKNTVYLLAFDPDMVAAAVADQYASGDDEAGYNFLEKIIQVPVKLPNARRHQIQKLFFEGLQLALSRRGVSLSDSELKAFERQFVAGIEPVLKSPRAAKRYINSISLSLPLLRGEVNVVDLMVLEAIRVFFPVLYRAIFENKDLHLMSPHGIFVKSEDREKRVQQLHKELLGDFDARKRDAAKRLVHGLFPRTTGQEYSSDWDAEQRIASPRYFDRYFSYSIGSDEVSDIEIDELLASASVLTIEELEEKLRALLKDNVENALDKLRFRQEEIDCVAAEKIAITLSRCGEILPNPTQFDNFLTPYSQGAFIITALVARLPKEDNNRIQIAQRVLKDAKLDFSATILTEFTTTDDDRRPDTIFDETQENILGQIVAKRIAEEAKEGGLIKTFPDSARRLWYIWDRWDNTGAASVQIEKEITDSPRNALELLESLVPIAWRSKESYSKSDFEMDQYRSLKEMVDPMIIMDALIEQYGSDLSDVEYERGALSQKSEKELLATQFAAVHRQALERG